MCGRTSVGRAAGGSLLALMVIACSGESESVPADAGGAGGACEQFAEKRDHEVTGDGSWAGRSEATHAAVVPTEGGGVRCFVHLDEGRWWLVGMFEGSS